MHRECGTLVEYAPEHNRAIGKMKATITQRFKTPASLATADCPAGTEFDVDCDCRFIFFCAKVRADDSTDGAGGVWKAKYVKLFYEKDKVVPVDGVHAPMFPRELLDSFPEGYSYLGAAQSMLGYPVTKHLPTAQDHKSWFAMYAKSKFPPMFCVLRISSLSEFANTDCVTQWRSGWQERTSTCRLTMTILWITSPRRSLP